MIRLKNKFTILLTSIFLLSVTFYSMPAPVSAAQESQTTNKQAAALTRPLQIVSQTTADDLNPSLNPITNTFNGGTCQGSLVVGWLLCGIIANLYALIQGFYNIVIIPGLQVDPLSNSTGPGSPEAYVYNVWNSFRVLANIIFIAIFILAILGQAFSWFFTPYELKKIIPRLVIGAVGIQISWYIVGFMIDLFNAIGAGTRGLILAPIINTNNSATNIGPGLGDSASLLQGNPGALIDLGQALGFDIGAGLAGAGLGAGVGIFFGAKGIVMGLVLILLPIAMLLVVTSIVIALRKIVLLLLVVTSPLAFALWILPNTQGIFKQWWELLWKSLLMYPLIVGLIAGGLLMSHTLDDADLNGGLKTIIGVIALFAPYALIPATFKFAGNILSTISGSIQGMDKSFREKLLGDPHSQWSFRGRLAEANSNRRMDRIGRWRDKKDKEGKISTTPFRDAFGMMRQGARDTRSAYGSGRSGRGRIRGVMGGLAASGRAAKSASAGAMGRIGVAAALKASPMLMGGRSFSEALAYRNQHMAQTVDDLAGYDSEILMALVAGRADAKNFITGGTISYEHGLAAVGGGPKGFGPEPLADDRAVVQRAFQLLMQRYSTHPEFDALRVSLLNNHRLQHHIGKEGMEKIWDVIRVSDLSDQINPEIRFMNLDGTSKFDPTTKEGRFEGVSAINIIHSKYELTRSLPRARAGFWDSFYENGSKITQLAGDQNFLNSLETDEERVAIKTAAANYKELQKRMEESVMDDARSFAYRSNNRGLQNLMNGNSINWNGGEFKLKRKQEKVTIEDANGQEHEILRDVMTPTGSFVYDLTDEQTRNWVLNAGTAYGGTGESKEAQRNLIYHNQVDERNAILHNQAERDKYLAAAANSKNEALVGNSAKSDEELRGYSFTEEFVYNPSILGDTKHIEQPGGGGHH